ncbi:glycosyltransferase family 4 protein [bacterium]|nr:glycosyltransferase family 4 protein [bacterium]
MLTNSSISLLLVLDSPLESNSSPALLNYFLYDFIATLGKKVDISLYYPVFSHSEEFYSLSVTEDGGMTRFETFIPPRFHSLEESVVNTKLDDIFTYILKEKSFDLVHIISLKNHSLNYPQIAKERRLPVMLTISDFFLRTPLLFADEQKGVKISNFISSPFYAVISRIERLFSKEDDISYWWYEQIGRYSSFYNRTAFSSDTVDDFLENRATKVEELLSMVDVCHFFSESLYSGRYFSMIEEHQAVVIEQGIDVKSVAQSRPFEIDGPVSFGFVGDIIPEEGIEKLISAMNVLMENGRHNALHIYGDVFQNREYYNKLNKLSKSKHIHFHGPVAPHRLAAILDSFDVLIVPSEWHRSDTYLIYTTIARRKAVISSLRSSIGEIVRKNGRGMVLDETTPETLYAAMIELETNRKKLYYHMRIMNDFPFVDIGETVDAFITHYKKIASTPPKEEMLLAQKRFRKRGERLREGR